MTYPLKVDICPKGLLPLPGDKITHLESFSVECTSAFPQIVDRVSLASLLGVSPSWIGYILRPEHDAELGKWVYRKNTFYHTFQVPKRETRADREKGVRRYRQIHAPTRCLKSVQKMLADAFWRHFPVSSAVTSYLPNVSITLSAHRHYGATLLISVDIKDYFPSIKVWTIKRFLEEHGYSHPVAKTISEICTYSNFLPQGSPCSPAVSNIIGSWLFDDRVTAVAQELGYVYTRYADDLTFSTRAEAPTNGDALVTAVADILADVGFQLNKKKTKYMRSNSPTKRQQVLGLCITPVNGQTEPFVRITRHKYKRVRAAIHNCLTLGFPKAAARAKPPMEPVPFFRKLQGYVCSFMKQCDPVRYKLLENEFKKAQHEFRLYCKTTSYQYSTSLPEILTTWGNLLEENYDSHEAGPVL